MRAFFAFLACLSSASASETRVTGQARQESLVKEWSTQLETQPLSPDTKVVAYESPIKRVVNLLEKMRDELDAEANKEAEMYDQMVCWCETNEKEKKKAIADAEALETELELEANERSAKSAKDATEIDRLKDEIAEQTKRLKQATAIREKQAAKFREENNDLVQWITNVKNAIEILSRHQKVHASFVQLDAPVLSSMHTVLKELAFKADLLRAGKAEGRHAQRGASFLSLDSDSMSIGDTLLNVIDSTLDVAAGGLPLEFAQQVLARTARREAKAAFLQDAKLLPTAGSYTTHSNAIFGILTTMKEEFEENLSEEQKEELKAQEDYEALAKAKAAQIKTAKELLDETEASNADNLKALSDANENLDLTREQRSKDVEFLQNLKTTCMSLDQEWERRSKTRSEETLAVTEALKIITADEHMDLLRDTVKFLQVNAETEMRMRRTRAVASLRKAAQSPAFEADDLLAAWHNRNMDGQKVSMLGAAGGPRMQLATLAVSVGLDSFTQIKAAMDKMVADLKKEQEDEVKFKEYCNSELNLNEKDRFNKNEEKQDLEMLIAKLTKLIKKLTEEIADATNQIAETETAILKASQVREGENAEFQTVVADQRATQEILFKALDKLKAFYKKQRGGALLQKDSQEPPVKFNSYKINSGSNPVIGLIEQIIQDSKALEKEAITGETEAQANYEKFVKDSNAMISSLQALIAEKTRERARASTDREQAKSDLDSANGELESLALTGESLHGECDWLLRNFAARQKARLDEIEAIGQAEAILSGQGMQDALSRA